VRYVRILMPAGEWIAGGFDDLRATDEPKPDRPSDPPAPHMDRRAYRDSLSSANHYIHRLNLMRHLLGEPCEVTRADPSGVLLLVRSRSGIAGTIEMSPYRTSVAWQESAPVAFERGYVNPKLPAPLACNRPGSVEILRDPGDGATPEVLCPYLPWNSCHARAGDQLPGGRPRGKTPPCESRGST